MISKDDVEIANWNLAHTWADGLGLEFAGVELGDLVTYSMLTVLGRIQLQHLEQLAAEQKQPMVQA